MHRPRGRSVKLLHGDITRLAELSGLPKSTVHRIASGITLNPGFATMTKYEAGLRRLKAERGRKPRGAAI